MFSGELEVARARNVILHTSLSSNKGQDRDNGLCGSLIVTNFKLSFITNDNEQVRIAFQLSIESIQIKFYSFLFTISIERYVSRQLIPSTE